MSATAAGEAPGKGRPAAPSRGWRRFDTLFLRLFLLLWVTLVASTLLGFEAFRATAPAGAHGPVSLVRSVPPLPSLPPVAALTGQARRLDRGPGAAGPDAGPGTGPGASPGPAPGPAFGAPPGAFPGATPPPPGTPADPGAPPRHVHVAAPRWSVWLDMLVRVLVIGAAAALAARWLSAPVHDLGAAARRLRAAVASSGPQAMASEPPQVDATRGSADVRATAQVFNEMARQLKADFDAQRLLLATVSHDLRTPLARLRLRLEAGDGASPRAAADIREMDELLEGLLDLFRPADATAPARVDAHALVQALLDDLPPGTPDVTLAGASTVVTCPPLALRRIVQNLLTNALRHSDDVSMTVGTDAATHTGGAEAVIRIEDRGPGLSPEQLAAAGTPFAHWDTVPPVPSAHAGHAGLGLGLHIARALAERAGGRLVLAPREGGGLRAELRLPVAG